MSFLTLEDVIADGVGNNYPHRQINYNLRQTTDGEGKMDQTKRG